MSEHQSSGAGVCDLHVTKGTCVAMFAYDIGFAIDLERAERTVARVTGAGAQRELLRHSRKSPRWFEYRPAPLRVMRRGRGIRVAGSATLESINAVIYDFGAVSIAYAIPIEGGVERLVEMSEALYENAELLADSRGHAEALLAVLGEAITKPGLVPLVEDYAVFHADAFTPAISEEGPASGPLALDAWRRSIARVLRAEPGGLSRDEVDYAMSSLVSYGEHDAAIVDWNAALLLGGDMEDALAVLEFANVELLEMRFLDDQLDRALENAYRATARPQRAFLSRKSEASLREIAELQVSNAVLFEGVNNTLKLLGDQYLARLYHGALTRFHLPDWDASILRKLGTLESIYNKLNDRQTARRMEALEWIIIALIAFEVFANWVWPTLQRWWGW